MPFVTPPLDVTLKRLHARVTDLMRLPVVDSRDWGAPSPTRAEDELRALVGELFDIGYQTRWAVDMIERSARDLPELTALLREEWQQPQLTRLEGYLSARMDRGELRQVGDVRVAATFVAENVTWFSRHRFHDPDGSRLDNASAKATVTALIVHAFALGRPQ